MLVPLVTLIVLMIAAHSRAESETRADLVSVRQHPAQIVLYTVHRGSYEGAGHATGELFATAGRKGVMPRGPATFAYLNNPELVASEHWLTEIRIPVGEDALELAGQLGAFTDVKRLPEMTVAVLRKEKGQAEVAPLIDTLARWLRANGYVPLDAHTETFLSHSISGDYASMETEIAVPVRKLGSG
jgi:effector-binding domain-containing protein